MEFDSEEERGIFAQEEEEEELESDFSSENNNNGFLCDVATGKDNTEVTNLSKPADKEDTTSKSTSPSDVTNDEFFSEGNFTDELIDNASELITLPKEREEEKEGSVEMECGIDEDGQSSLTSSSKENRDTPLPCVSLSPQGGVVMEGDAQSSSESDTSSTESEETILSSDDKEKKEMTVCKELSKKTPQSNRSLPKKHRRRCGECSSCLIEEDCRACRFCKDMRKFGGPGKLRQKCIARQCIKLSRVLYTEDPLVSRGETQLQEDMKTELERVSALPRTDGVKSEKNQILIVSKTHPGTAAIIAQSIAEHKTKLVPKPPKKQPPVKKPTSKKPSSNQQVKKRNTKRQRNYISNDSDDQYDYSAPPTRRRPLSVARGDWGRGSKSVRDQMQCEGLECVYAARPHSKYCSDECGIQLALR